MPRFGAGADFQGPLTWLRHRAVGGSGSLIGADNLLGGKAPPLGDNLHAEAGRVQNVVGNLVVA